MKKIALLLLSLLSTSVFAGVVQVYPVHLFASDQQASQSVHLKNEGDTPLTYQASMYRWAQSKGRDELTPTSDVLVSPVIVTVPAHSERIVRFMRLHPLPGHVDTYKLLLRQLATGSDSSSASHGKGTQTHMRVLVNQLLPVVFAPSSLPPAHVTAHMDGHALVLSNDGGSVLQLQSIGPSGKPADKQGALGWLLPGGGLTLQGPYHSGEALSINRTLTVSVE